MIKPSLSQPPIVLSQVLKNYETPSGPFAALNNVNLEIKYGEFVAIVGKSGSGKSTLLNVIAGIDRPTSGSVVVAGQAIDALNEQQLSRWRGATVGIVFQFFQLLPTLTVLENIMLAMDFCEKYPSHHRRARALELLVLVDMLDQANKLPFTLSGGQQQRVAIARAMANSPSLIIADEPTGNLDSATAAIIIGLLRALANNGTTVIVATHDEDVAALCDRTIVVVDGKLELATPVRTAQCQQGAA